MKDNVEDNRSVTEYCNQLTKRIVGVSILLGCFIIVVVAIFTLDLVSIPLIFFTFIKPNASLKRNVVPEVVPVAINKEVSTIQCEVPSISTGQLHVIVSGHNKVKQSDYQQFTDFGYTFISVYHLYSFWFF